MSGKDAAFLSEALSQQSDGAICAATFASTCPDMQRPTPRVTHAPQSTHMMQLACLNARRHGLCHP